MYKYKQEMHSDWCASLNGSPSEPCDCPASEIDEQESFKCDVCGRGYCSKTALKIHLTLENKKPRFHIKLLREEK